MSVLLGSGLVLLTSDLAAQSDLAADEVAPTRAGSAGAAEPASLAELNEALAATEATLEDLSRAAEAVASVRQLRQELQVVTEQNQLLSSDLASAEREREDAQVTIEQLRRQLAVSGQQVSELKETNTSLSADLQAFQTAASNAAGGLRQNLETIKGRVATLTAELSSAALGSSGAAAPAGSAAGQATPEASADQALGANRPGSALAEGGDADRSPGPQALASDLAGAPGNDPTPQIRALLTELRPTIDRRGLLVSVPGGELFRTGSDEIQQASYPTLAKVAELINTYSGRQVLILGHTDATGEDDYNQQLSKRRADLVKQFLVDNFEIEASRLLTEGKGEEVPIASNLTSAGREANRRVEVLLLN